MPSPAAARSAAPAPNPGAGLRALVGWTGALVLPAIPFLVALYGGGELLPEFQRLVLLVLVAVAAALFGVAPGVLAAIVATVSTAYDPTPSGHWAIAGTSSWVMLGAFAACAVVVAIAAGAGHGARASIGVLQRMVMQAERGEEAQREATERATADVQSLRAALARRDAELAAAREAVTRAEQARRDMIAALPPELRAPHVAVPTPLQLFPPIFTAAPLGVPPIDPPFTPASDDAAS
ncbi:MAG: hypothetical protein JO180_01175 [Gemmatirosa sp.]|nr:hypothetical protein [Gemmatirosa sp.]